MNASIYSMNGGKELVWQLGNSRTIREKTETGFTHRYQVRKNAKSEWRKAFYGKHDALQGKVEAALATK
ncbi:hypothetical protein [Serratia inhibens]